MHKGSHYLLSLQHILFLAHARYIVIYNSLLNSFISTLNLGKYQFNQRFIKRQK